MLRLGLSLAIALALSGCNDYGPVGSLDYSILIKKALDDSDGFPKLLGAGIWYPETHGFDEVRHPMRMRPPVPVSGALIITDNSVLFARWDENRGFFSIVRRISFPDIESAGVDRFGSGRRLILRSSGRLFDSFEFIQADGRLVDAEKTEQAAILLQDPAKADPRIRSYP